MDSNDWKTPSDMSGPKAVFSSLTTAQAASMIALEHDTGAKTVSDLAPFIVAWAQARNLQLVTVATCLGDANPAAWYRQVAIPAGWAHVCTANTWP